MHRDFKGKCSLVTNNTLTSFWKNAIPSLKLWVYSCVAYPKLQWWLIQNTYKTFPYDQQSLM